MPNRGAKGMRTELERRMGLEALDIYGLSEVMGPGIAQECADSKGALTLWEDHFFPEIIDPGYRHAGSRRARR